MMLAGTSAILLNMLAMFSITFLLIAGSQALLGRVLYHRIRDLSLPLRVRFLWCFILAPWLISMLVTVLVTHLSLQESHVYPQWLIAGINWHHISRFSLHSWHSVCITFVLIWVAYGLFKQLQQGYQSYCREQLLHSQAQRHLVDAYYVIETSAPQVFTAGFWQPRCYITSGLLAQVTSQELAVILAHEQAHIVRRDPLQRWLFALLSSPLLKRDRVAFNQLFMLTLEQRADQAALSVVATPTTVAQTLVNVARLLLAHQNCGTVARNTCGFAQQQLQARIAFLLKGAPVQPLSWRWIVFTMFSVIGSIAALDMVHHGVEYLLGRLE